MSQTSPVSPEAYAQASAQINGELNAIMEQIPSYQGMRDMLVKADDDLKSDELSQLDKLNSAVGALVFCQLEQFKNVLKNMANRATILEQSLKDIEKQQSLVKTASVIPDGVTGGQGRGKFGR